MIKISEDLKNILDYTGLNCFDADCGCCPEDQIICLEEHYKILKGACKEFKQVVKNLKKEKENEKIPNN